MLEKLSLVYDPAEDRIVLTLQLGGSAGTQRRVLALTRRICATWRGDLAAMAELAEREPQSAYAAQKAAPGFASTKPVKEPAELPAAGATGDSDSELEAAAVVVELVTRITCARRRADGRWVLKFQLRAGQPFSLTMSDTALADLSAALARRIKAAQWALPPLKDPAKPIAPQARRSLH
jgi:hypothetical protein